MKFIILITLIVLLNATGITGQIQPADTGHVKIELKEFQYIIAQFIELDASRKLNNNLNAQIGIMNRALDDQSKIIDIRNKIIDDLKQEVEDVKPSWWNKFSWGFGTAVALIVAVLFLTK